MSADELLIIEKLNVCRYAPGTWSKRFITDLFHIAKANSEYLLTEPQREWIYRVLYQMRKQVPFTYEKFKKNKYCKKVKAIVE